jgi:MFS family permease
VLGLFVGTLIDRFDRWRTVVATESLSLLSAAALAVLTLSGSVTVWELYLLATLQGVVSALDSPARHALVFEMVGVDDLPNASRAQLEPRDAGAHPRPGDRGRRDRARGRRRCLRDQRR